MSRLSKIHNFYTYDDGDTITPRMVVSLASGYGFQQYWDVTAGKVTETDFSKHPATLYPQPYSSKLGSVVVPETVGQQWYFNSLTTEGAILEDGAVKSKWASLFEVTTVSVNGKTFPALKIKGNIATADDYTDKFFYYQSTYDGKTFTCQQELPIQASAGSSCKLLLSVEGQDGSGDDVLSNDNDWVKYTAYLQMSGVTITEGVTFAWSRFVNGTWQALSNSTGLTEIAAASGQSSLKLFNAAVEGVELYKCVATYQSKTYEEVFQATDIHDPYYIVDGCNIIGEAVQSGETVTFSPQVYDRSTGELATGDHATSKWTFAYTYVNAKTRKVISSLSGNSISYGNIKAQGGISVVIEATISD